MPNTVRESRGISFLKLSGSPVYTLECLIVLSASCNVPVLQDSAGLPSHCLDVRQVSHRDLSMAADGIQCVCAGLLSVSVLGVQPQAHTSSMLVSCTLFTVCESLCALSENCPLWAPGL